MVDKNTVVKAPMELYPVYRTSPVHVQSNIDTNLDDPGSVRYLSRTDSGDQISLEVKAVTEVVGKDGTKYDFVGWSRDYKGNDSYTLMTGDKTYFLDGNEPFREVTYTAIYKLRRLSALSRHRRQRHLHRYGRPERYECSAWPGWQCRLCSDS